MGIQDDGGALFLVRNPIEHEADLFFVPVSVLRQYTRRLSRGLGVDDVEVFSGDNETFFCAQPLESEDHGKSEGSARVHGAHGIRKQCSMQADGTVHPTGAGERQGAPF